jgi:hypothetical protein
MQSSDFSDTAAKDIVTRLATLAKRDSVDL